MGISSIPCITAQKDIHPIIKTRAESETWHCRASGGGVNSVALSVGRSSSLQAHLRPPSGALILPTSHPGLNRRARRRNLALIRLPTCLKVCLRSGLARAAPTVRHSAARGNSPLPARLSWATICALPCLALPVLCVRTSLPTYLPALHDWDLGGARRSATKRRIGVRGSGSFVTSKDGCSCGGCVFFFFFR